MSTVCVTDVKDAVKEKLDAGEAFTSACISHPMIASDKNVRHRDVSAEVKSLWRHRQMADPIGLAYLRTLVTVYPDGPGTAPAQAYLYYPDNGFDPNVFTAKSRVLIRNHGDGDDGITVTNTADGSSVSKQCQVQSIQKSLTIPKFIMNKLGWAAGDGLDIKWNNGIEIKRHLVAPPDGAQKVDKEGRIRLHGGTVSQLGVNNPTAMLVEPDASLPYILVSALAQTPAPATTDDSTDNDDDKVSIGRGISVWDNDKPEDSA